MRKTGKYREALPVIHNSQTLESQKIKNLLFTIKEKKLELQEKITRTEMNEQQQQDFPQEYNVRERVITEIPCLQLKEGYLRRHQEKQQIKSFYQTKAKMLTVEEQREKQVLSNQSKLTKRKSILEPVANRVKEEKTIETARFSQLFSHIPKNPKERTDENIKILVSYLIENNMFFAKISPVLTTCYIKLNRLLTFQKHSSIYRTDEERDMFYLILGGKVKLFEVEPNFKKFKKICHPGQTLAEELLFEKSVKKKVLENAKAITRCYLVEIKLENYSKMKEEMMRYGYKLIFLEMESIIKRNYITKNWQRSEGAKFYSKK